MYYELFNNRPGLFHHSFLLWCFIILVNDQRSNSLCSDAWKRLRLCHSRRVIRERVNERQKETERERGRARALTDSLLTDFYIYKYIESTIDVPFLKTYREFLYGLKV